MGSPAVATTCRLGSSWGAYLPRMEGVHIKTSIWRILDVSLAHTPLAAVGRKGTGGRGGRAWARILQTYILESFLPIRSP